MSSFSLQVPCVIATMVVSGGLQINAINLRVPSENKRPLVQVDMHALAQGTRCALGAVGEAIAMIEVGNNQHDIFLMKPAIEWLRKSRCPHTTEDCEVFERIAKNRLGLRASLTQADLHMGVECALRRMQNVRCSLPFFEELVCHHSDFQQFVDGWNAPLADAGVTTHRQAA